MRLPLASAFRNAFEKHDAKRRADSVDEEGERVVSGRRTTGHNVVSEAMLQKIVAGEIETLMNTINLASTEDLSAFEEVSRSILNYGIPDVVHRTIDEADLSEIVTEIAEALSIYEPRLEPQSIKVTRDARVDNAELRVRFVVRADLRCDPLNLPVEFVADVERESGTIAVAGR